ncbi:MAG TPA: folylpolyglutamate synthase/dihydrofolate synthase family protein [Phycisphaerae bacterium]|nr:folylpolyglutamate synthase/dihydrofolate synthase family protein [Phycisphaerae bacterium]HRY70185.1 folylpolyglutamate synthase/dihydrofolate synthase family protein [Phycisphaerae bacterium]HSA27400.1 folylpolyglutamate synthase/dihydrofolate synthase family protein [Phycisphaerae bacterium]
MAQTLSVNSRIEARKRAPAAIRTYEAAISFLNTATDYEKMARVGYNTTTFNLSRMNRLLTSLGNPHKKLRSVHIAGTKGKGSTAAMLSSMLANAGLKVGLYTSPHLVDLRERIQINGEMIPESEMTRLIARIAPIVRKQTKDEPTFFEIMTAVAFQYFIDQEVDIAVIEAGLGGRLDSTNVLKPEVCGITSISYDHMSQLGGTLEAIAEEKAGIFKPGVPVVSSPQPKGVRMVLAKAAEKVKAPLLFTGKEIEFSYRFESSRALGPHTRVSLSTGNSRFEHLAVPMPGDHQAINCGLALSLMAILKERGFQIDDQKAIQGLAKTRLPGRMEIIHEQPRILIDGAHNAASVEALMRAIGQNITYDSMVVIFGCRSDKDVNGMLNHIQLGADKVIFTTTGSPRSCDPAELAAEYMERSGKMAQVAERLEDALEIAERAVTREDLICITGSFYLAGLAKRIAEKRYGKGKE